VESELTGWAAAGVEVDSGSQWDAEVSYAMVEMVIGAQQLRIANWARSDGIAHPAQKIEG
jgi:hypothetical protein